MEREATDIEQSYISCQHLPKRNLTHNEGGTARRTAAQITHCPFGPHGEEGTLRVHTHWTQVVKIIIQRHIPEKKNAYKVSTQPVAFFMVPFGRVNELTQIW